MLNAAGVEAVEAWLRRQGLHEDAVPVLANYLLSAPSAENDEALGDVISIAQWRRITDPDNESRLRWDAQAAYAGSADGEPWTAPGTDHLQMDDEDEDEEDAQDPVDGPGGNGFGGEDADMQVGEQPRRAGSDDEESVRDEEVEHIHDEEEHVHDDEEQVHDVEEPAHLGEGAEGAAEDQWGDIDAGLLEDVDDDPGLQQLRDGGQGAALPCQVISLEEFYRLVHQAVQDADAHVNAISGTPRQRDWCQAQAAGQPQGVTNAMTDGTAKHAEAERRLRQSLAGRRLADGLEVKIEATYAWRRALQGRFQQAPVFRGENVQEAGTIRPDVVVHDANAPGAAQVVIDFKFPCPASNLPGAGFSNHPDFQGMSRATVYQAILQPPTGVFLVSPRHGYMQQ